LSDNKENPKTEDKKEPAPAVDWQKKAEELEAELKKLRAAAAKPKKENKEAPAATEKPHLVHTYDEKCPECGLLNPLNVPPEKMVFCNGCEGFLGNEDNLEKLEKCPHCGKDEGAHHK
jgi:rRNA maturation protein Nop10